MQLSWYKMTEDQWLTTTDLKQLLYHATTELRYDRKIRLFSVACIKRILSVYNMEVKVLVKAAEELFDGGIGCIKNLQVMAEGCSYQAPFHLARYKQYCAAIGVIEGILVDTGWTDHGCLPLFRSMMGNPFHQSVMLRTPSLRKMAERVYATESSAGPLADALDEQLGRNNELSKQLRLTDWHPKGSWVLDIILEKPK